MHNVSPLAAPRLSKAQLELLDSTTDLKRYLEMVAAGVIAGPVDPEAPCLLAVKDALRVVRMQGVWCASESAALPQATPTAYSQAMNPPGKSLRQAHVEGMDDMLRSTEPRAFDHAAEASAIAGIALNLSTGEVAA